MSWSFHLTDIATDTLIADVTSLCTAKISARLNRPLQITLDMPADQAALKTVQGDGDPALWVGTRAIKAYRNGTLRGHCIVWTLTYDAGEDYDMRVQVLALDPAIRWNTRQVWDSTGHVAYPTFTNPIDGGTLLKQANANAITYEDDLGTPLIFPISNTAWTISTTTNVWYLIPDAPLTIGDLYSTLTDTGVCDIQIAPVDSSMGFAAGVMGKIVAANTAGSDKSATVKFEYDAGSKNVGKARRVIDAGTLGNEIVYELGPKIDKNHYRGNISGTEAALATPWQSKQLASRAKYGSYTEYRVYDDDGDSASRPLFYSLWKTEVTLRVNPRDLIYFTPAAGGDNFSQFAPFDDFVLGDLVGISCSDNLGPAISSAAQRIYGFDVEQDEDGVERLGELVCSADAE